MKITLSKSQWEGIGKQAGWMKVAMQPATQQSPKELGSQTICPVCQNKFTMNGGCPACESLRAKDPAAYAKMVEKSKKIRSQIPKY